MSTGQKNHYIINGNCKNNVEIYTKKCLYTLPKYLILSFIRNVDDEFFFNNIKYDEELDIKLIIMINHIIIF